ncbi:MAG: DUF502 domain-containing protein [Deferribacterales bacterium]
MIKRFRVFLQRSFIAGILSTLPLFVTFWFILFIFEKFSGFFLPYLEMINRRMEITMPLYMEKIISFMLVIVFLIIIGVIAKNYFGKKLLKLIEDLAERIPFIRSIYSSIRQVVDAFQTAGGGSFKKVVMIEYPRKGMYSMGFMTKDTSEFLNRATGEICVNIFIPTTPNPTSGFVLVVPKKDIIDPGISVDHGIKFIISAGLVEPNYTGSIEEK